MNALILDENRQFTCIFWRTITIIRTKKYNMVLNSEAESYIPYRNSKQNEMRDNHYKKCNYCRRQSRQ